MYKDESPTAVIPALAEACRGTVGAQTGARGGMELGTRVRIPDHGTRTTHNCSWIPGPTPAGACQAGGSDVATDRLSRALGYARTWLARGLALGACKPKAFFSVTERRFLCEEFCWEIP